MGGEQKRTSGGGSARGPERRRGLPWRQVVEWRNSQAIEEVGISGMDGSRRGAVRGGRSATGVRREDRVFRALADPTRRRVLERLARGPASVSELAKPFDMALPSFVAHLRVLEESGLVGSRKSGRVRTYHMEPAGLRHVEDWLARQRELWERRLDQLDAYLEQLDRKERS